jgi:Ca2+-binding EF-hand superfamily protein
LPAHSSRNEDEENLRDLLGKFARRLGGNFPDDLSRDLFDAADLARTNRMTMEELAEDALRAKLSD